MRLRSILPLGFVAVSALALAAQAMDLKWSPKVGDKSTYKVSGNFDLGGGEITLTGTRTEEIKSVDADKVVISAFSKLAVNAMGMDVPVPDSTTSVTSKPDGTFVGVEVDGKAGEGSELRFARVSTFLYPSKPVAVNDTWSFEAAKDEKLDLPGVKIEFKLVGDEKIGNWDCWKITGKGGEVEGATPTKIDGTYWVQKSNGLLVRSVAQLTDALLNPQAPPLSGKLQADLQP